MQSALKLVKSGRATPCPICDRTKDGDCRMGEADNLVLCHSRTDETANTKVGDYVFLKSSKDGLWGVWVYQKLSEHGKTSGRKPRRQQVRESYFYTDRDGNKLVKVERIPEGDGKKFAQYHLEDGCWVPKLPDPIKRQIPIYRHAEVREAIAKGKPIFMVEGEAKCDRLWKMGIAATTTIGGSKGYRSYGSDYKSDLEGANLILCPDRDKAGIEHMENINRDFPNARWCRVFPNSPIWQCLPDSGGLDVGDWIEFGATEQEIFEAVEAQNQPDKARDNSKTKEALMSAIDRLKTVADPYERVLAENEISERFKVRGSKLDLLLDYEPSEEVTVSSMPEVVLSVFNKIEERWRNPAPTGLLTGFYDLDAMTQGFQPQDLIVVAARPSQGKTALLLNMVRNICTWRKSQGEECVALVFSLEMSKEQLVQRMLSAETRIESGRLASGRVNENEWTKIVDGINVIGELGVLIDETSTYISQIEAAAGQVEKERGKIDIIAVDYLQLIDSPGDNRNIEIGRITRKLKLMAKRFDCPVVALSQLSRGVESRQDKRPVMSDLRDSGSIEADADVILMLYRDEYYNPETGDTGVAEVLVRKHRNGPVGTVKLLFESEYTQFRNLASR